MKIGNHPRMRSQCWSQNQASALVTTLMVITVLSIIAVAFMQSMRIERMTSRSYANQERARLAADAGGDYARALISYALTTNATQGQSYVVGQTNDSSGQPLLVIGNANLTNITQIIPLVSGNFSLLVGYPGNMTEESVRQYMNTRTNLSPEVSVGLNKKVTIIDGVTNRLIQQTSDTNLFRASWVNITNEIGQTNARFAFVVLDENARFNPHYHGEGLSRSNSTNWFFGAGSFPLVTGNVTGFSLDQATKMRTVGMNAIGLQPFGQGFTTQSEYEGKKHLLTTEETVAFDVIPMGLPDAGKPKYSINDLATNNLATNAMGQPTSTPTLRAENIADIIDRNLPDFKKRDASLLSLPDNDKKRYLNRLAANIVDYIDVDSEPTVVNGGEPAGRDLFPLVVAIAERYQRTALNTSTDPSTTTIENQAFVQVWNLYTTPIVCTGNATLVLKNRMKITFGGGISSPFSDYSQTIPLGITIRPNEFVVLEFPSVSQTWTSPGSASITPKFVAGSPDESADTMTHPYFEFYWNGQLVDMNRRAPVAPGVANAGLPHNAKDFTTASNHWQCFFLPSYPGAGGWRTVGDPRGQFLSNYDWVAISSDTSYKDNTRWKGRQMDTSPRYQDYKEQWKERDYVRENPSVGSAPGTITKTPAQVTSNYGVADSVNAPALIKNSGLVSIGELGNVFDPAQVDDQGNAPSGGDPSSIYVAAGGRTLRIGQPESAYPMNPWNVEGKRAAELVDIFTVRSKDTNYTDRAKDPNYGFPVAHGKINVNTAPTEVLEALFVEISPTSDGGVPVSFISLLNATSLAQAVITNRPYNKLSDLYKITSALSTATNYIPALPSYTTATGTNLAIMDRAREETFGKIIELTSVQSRAFRVYVIGQALDLTGKSKAQAVAEAVITVSTDTNGSPHINLGNWRWAH